jgi:hypothetical protein
MRERERDAGAGCGMRERDAGCGSGMRERERALEGEILPNAHDVIVDCYGV